MVDRPRLGAPPVRARPRQARKSRINQHPPNSFSIGAVRTRNTLHWPCARCVRTRATRTTSEVPSACSSVSLSPQHFNYTYLPSSTLCAVCCVLCAVCCSPAHLPFSRPEPAALISAPGRSTVESTLLAIYSSGGLECLGGRVVSASSRRPLPVDR
jgi:hypothetical protein